MVIMSDMENFSLKAGCIILFILFVAMLAMYLNVRNSEPETIVVEPCTEVVCDTVYIRDTIYQWKSQVIKNDETSNAVSDTERREQW